MVWVVGSSRSGSTWLSRMLGELAGATVIDDPHLGHHLGVWRPIPLAWAAAERRPDLVTLPELLDDRPDYFFSTRYEDSWRPWLRGLICARFAAQAADSGASPRFVIVKEPGSQSIALLTSLFPRSRLVFLLRDGRDVVDSWLAAYSDGGWAQDVGGFPVADEGREAFIRWQASVWAYRAAAVKRAFDRHDPDRRALVRYEELLTDPVAALEAVCVALGANPGPKRLAQIAATHDFDNVSVRRKGPLRHIRAASPGGWRRSMSRAEQSAMLEELGDELVRFGYLPEADSRGSRRRDLRRVA